MPRGGPWQIENRKRRYSCFGRVCVDAKAVSQQKMHQLRQANPALTEQQARRQAGVRVRFLGRRPRGPAQRIDTVDFLMFPGGRRDPTVDPQWYTNRKRR